MRSHIRIISAAAAVMLAFCSALPQIISADTGDTIQKEYEFTAQDKDQLHYPALEEITEAGVTYRLKDISYEIIEQSEPVSVERKVITDDPEDYPKTVTKKIDGTAVTLKAQEPSWEKRKVQKTYQHIVKEYVGEETPAEQITVQGDVYRILTENSTERIENFRSTAIFTAEDENTIFYRFQGKLVEIAGDDPVWNGYEQDLGNYLGFTGSTYTIDSMKWDGGFISNGDGYERKAIVSGTKKIPVRTVTYTNDTPENEEYEYVANIRYVDQDTAADVRARAIATYEKSSKGLSKAAMIMVGAGTAVLVLAAASLIYYLARRRSQEE